MAVNYAITPKNSSASYVKDLTSTSINPDAAPTSTPRQGGFTLRNRVDFSKVALANRKLFTLTGGTAATAGNVLRVLEVPARTLVKNVEIFAVKDKTIPGTAVSLTAGGLHASHLASLVITVGAEQRSKPTSSASYNALSHIDIQGTAQRSLAAGGQFGAIALKKAGSSCAFSSNLVEKIDSSMTAPELGRVITDQKAAGSAYMNAYPGYFPLGGYVYVAAGPHGTGTGNQSDASASKVNSDYVALSGVWEFQADCTYVPE